MIHVRKNTTEVRKCRFETHIARRAVYAIMILLATGMYDNARAGAAPHIDRTEARVANVLQVLPTSYSAGTLDDLQRTINKLSLAVDMSAISTSTAVARRRTVLRAWTLVLRSIDLSYDPAFDVTKPVSCPDPPPDADGTRLPPCADPNEIHDAKARATYAAALWAFDQQMKRATFYRNIRNLDDNAMLSLSIAMSQFRRIAPADTSALDFILRQSGLSISRQERIAEML